MQAALAAGTSEIYNVYVPGATPARDEVWL